MPGLTMLACAFASLLLVQAGCGVPATKPPVAMPEAKPDLRDTTPLLIVADSEESLWPDPVERTHVRLSSLQHLIDGHRQRTGRLPASMEELLPDSADRSVLARDAWGSRITFRRLADDYELRSHGLDRVFRTADDLVATSTSEMPVFRRPPGHRTQIRLASLRTLITLYHVRSGDFPETLEDLAGAGLSPYLGTIDEWSRPIVYSRLPDEFEVRSAGADGALNSADDIVVRGLDPMLSAPNPERGATAPAQPR